MPAFLLSIDVEPSHQYEAISTLADIERASRDDAGCLYFTWFRHESDPHRFTLVEHWDTQEHLDEHLGRIIPRWREFEPSLVTDPISEPIVPVAALLAAATGPAPIS